MPSLKTMKRSRNEDRISLALDYFGIFLEWIHVESQSPGTLASAARCHAKALRWLEQVEQ